MKRARSTASAGQLDLFGGASFDHKQATGVTLPPPPPAFMPDGSFKLPEAFRLEHNLALVAGAGTGKTHSLVTLCLHLLAGARALPDKNAEECRVEPERLGLLTFTDKAAAEMRERLWQRVDALAHGDDSKEPELKAAMALLERPMPKAAFWRQRRDELASAPIGTFHALCVQLLRRAPAGSGVSAGFEVLTEQQSRRLMIDCAERAVLEALEAQNADVAQMVEAWHFLDESGFSVAGGLVAVFTRMREEGVKAKELEHTDAEAAMRALEASLRECRALCAEACLSPDRAVSATAGDCARLLEQFDGSTAVARLFELKAVLSGRKPKGVTALKQAIVGGGKDDRSNADLDPQAGFGLLHHVLTLAALPHEQAVKALLESLEKRYDHALAAAGALDFNAMLVKTRDLLRDDLQARREEQARFGALLVDEFQDTNRLQLELVHLLAERRDGVRQTTPPLPFAEGLPVDELPLEPGFVCIAGDRKQSIYEFRGSDVAVFEQAARAIEASGGGRAYLQQSRRASPKLVEFFNVLFPTLMPTAQALVAEPLDGHTVIDGTDGRRPYVVGFSPAGDRLTAHRTLEPAGVAVDVLEMPAPLPEDAEAQREGDARAVAAHVAQLLGLGHEAGAAVVDRRSGELRPARGGDVALLFRRFTFVEQYRQALLREGVACRVVRGRGFYAAQEVVDLACLLQLTADPADALALAAVLRSPLVGLTDASLLSLSQVLGGRIDGRAALALDAAPDMFSPIEKERFESFVALWRSLTAHARHMGARAMLKVALEQTHYREALAGAPYAEQALANIEKLLELAFAHDTNVAEGAASFARTLLELVDAESVEAQAATIDDGDETAVTLCTIHQAKGLEWPVVVVPDLNAATMPRAARFRFTRPNRLSVDAVLKVFDTDGVSFERARVEQKHREEAEAKRLLYVALTRARDLLVIGTGASRRGTWSQQLREVLARPEVKAHTRTVTPVRGARPKLRLVPGPHEVARFVEPPPPVVRSATLPVTALQDFVMCPRRYSFIHDIGLSERARAVASVEQGAHGDIRERGTAAHRLLELVPLSAIDTPALSRVLREIEAAEGLPDDAEVRQWVERFLGTKLAHSLKSAGDSAVYRELSFMLRLERGSFELNLKGQIDLLLAADDGAALVVDYKTTKRPPEGLDAYRFQLGCYALAAQHFVKPGTPIRTGIVFLRDDAPEVLLDDRPVEKQLGEELARQAEALVKAQLLDVWEGLPKERCEANGCGFVARCHSL